MNLICVYCDNEVYGRKIFCKFHYLQDYRKRNADKIKKDREKYKEKAKEYHKKWRLNNPDYFKNNCRKWYYEKGGKEKVKEYCKKNKEKINLRNYIRYHTDEEYKNRINENNEKSNYRKSKKRKKSAKEYYKRNKKSIIAKSIIYRDLKNIKYRGYI